MGGVSIFISLPAPRGHVLGIVSVYVTVFDVSSRWSHCARGGRSDTVPRNLLSAVTVSVRVHIQNTSCKIKSSSVA